MKAKPRTIHMKCIFFNIPSVTLKSLLPIFREFISLNSYKKTNVWKIYVSISFLACPPSVESLGLSVNLNFNLSPKSIGPKMIKKRRTKRFQRAIPMTCLQMTGLRISSCALNVVSERTESRGGSVARAKAAKVSMIMLTQRSCEAVSGESAKKNDATQQSNKAEKLTVN